MSPSFASVSTSSTASRDADRARDELDARLAAGAGALQNRQPIAALAIAQAFAPVERSLDPDAIIPNRHLSPSVLEASIERIGALRASLYLQGWHRHSELLVGRVGAGPVLLGAAALPVHDALVPIRHDRDPATSSARAASRRAG